MKKRIKEINYSNNNRRPTTMRSYHKKTTIHTPSAILFKVQVTVALSSKTIFIRDTSATEKDRKKRKRIR